MPAFEDLILRDTRANQPAAGKPGRLQYVTDESVMERDNGATWDDVSAASGGDASSTTYTPTTAADWDSSADPGNVDDALDQLAGRVTDVEGGAAPVYPSQVSVNPFIPSAKVGNFAVTVGTSDLMNGVYMQSASPALHDYVEYLVLLAAGTWRVDILFYRNTNRAIATATLDGSSIGTIDEYGTLVHNIAGSITSISVATTGVKTLRLQAESKNGSSSDYYLSFNLIVFTKTA
jgi:hypothetical protein